MELKSSSATHTLNGSNTEVEGIEHGRAYVFPKIDGTNASMWRSSGRYHFTALVIASLVL